MGQAMNAEAGVMGWMLNRKGSANKSGGSRDGTGKATR